MRGSMPARPLVLAVFLGWSLLTSIRDRLGILWPPVSRRSEHAPPRESRSVVLSGAIAKTATSADSRTWLN